MPLVHTPSLVVLVSSVVCPSHTVVAPPIVAGNGITVTNATAEQPVGNVYTILAVPADMPLTTPVGDTVATDGAPADQIPPGVGATNVLLAPTHNDDNPSIGSGAGFTT